MVSTVLKKLNVDVFTLNLVECLSDSSFENSAIFLNQQSLALLSGPWWRKEGLWRLYEHLSGWRSIRGYKSPLLSQPHLLMWFIWLYSHLPFTYWRRLGQNLKVCSLKNWGKPVISPKEMLAQSVVRLEQQKRTATSVTGVTWLKVGSCREAPPGWPSSLSLLDLVGVNIPQSSLQL